MTKHFDAVVVGGGLSGAMAAMAMAREGLSVLLAEKSGSLGGAATVNYVLPFMEYRILPNVASIGEGAGIALSLCHKLKCPTYALDIPTLAKAIDAYDLVEREEETE